jgi:hypothetical protein
VNNNNAWRAGLKVAQSNADQNKRSRDASLLEKRAQKHDWKAMVRLGQVRPCAQNDVDSDVVQY